MEQITRDEMIELLKDGELLAEVTGNIDLARRYGPAIAALQAAEPVGIVVDNCGKNFVNWRGETPWLDSAKPGTELFTLPCPPAKVSHWSFENPGRADQYRAEALAARRALGFKEGADDVAPADLEDAINALRQPATELAPESWREELETIAEILEADGDEWNCAARIRKMLAASPVKAQVPEGVNAELIAEILSDYASLQQNGVIDSAGRYSPADAMEQADLLLTASPAPDHITGRDRCVVDGGTCGVGGFCGSCQLRRQSGASVAFLLDRAFDAF